MDSREIISVLQRDGWVQVAQKGSHVQFKHPTKRAASRSLIPNGISRSGLLKGIEKQSGLKLR
jgi:predicted RNA binding protein YcfA (HicA-like mRNA interferase family)